MTSIAHLVASYDEPVHREEVWRELATLSLSDVPEREASQLFSKFCGAAKQNFERLEENLRRRNYHFCLPYTVYEDEQLPVEEIFDEELFFHHLSKHEAEQSAFHPLVEHFVLIVGSINFCGYFRDLEPSIYSDPVFVDFWRPDTDSPFPMVDGHLVIGPDAKAKDGACYDPYLLELPDRFDPIVVLGDVRKSFVQYLNEAFAVGGMWGLRSETDPRVVERLQQASEGLVTL